MIRKPSTDLLLAAGGINVQSDIISQICASMPRFRSLIAACTTDASLVENSTVSRASLLGGIETDPVFNRYRSLRPDTLQSGCLLRLMLRDEAPFTLLLLFNSCSLSPLYDASVDASDYYNTSEHSEDMNPNSGLPYGFFHHPMEGLQDGYPLVVSAGISEKRVRETLQFIEYGGLLNREASKMLTLKVGRRIIEQNIYTCYQPS